MQKVENFLSKNNSLLSRKPTYAAQFWAKFVLSSEKVWANLYKNFNLGKFAAVKILE